MADTSDDAPSWDKNQNLGEGHAPVEYKPPPSSAVMGQFEISGPEAHANGLMFQAQMLSRQSPYPPPDEAERFEKLAPGAFDRILKLVEQKQAADIQLALTGQAIQRSDTKRGQYLGFAANLSALSAAVACSVAGQQAAAVACVSIPVMSIAALLVRGQIRPASPRAKQPDAVKPSPEKPDQLTHQPKPP